MKTWGKNRRNWSRKAAMAMLTALLLLGPPAQPAGATAAAGVCELQLDLTSSTVGLLDMNVPSWNVVGDGLCSLGTHASASLTGGLTGVAGLGIGSCAAGVYVGNLTLRVGGEDVDSAHVLAVMAGPVLHITMAAAPLPALVGTGVFVELNTDATAACLTSTATGTVTRTWEGVFAFGGLTAVASPALSPDSGAPR